MKVKNQQDRPGKKIKVAAIALVTIAGVAGVSGYLSSTRTGSQRDPASDDSKMSFEEAQAKLAEVEAKKRLTKEWAWAKEGQTELLIEAYRKVEGGNTRAREQRSRIINALGTGVRAKAQWPAGYTAQKAKEVSRFLIEALREAHGPDADAGALLKVLVASAKAMPEYYSGAEPAIRKFYEGESRPALQLAALDALAQLKSGWAIGPLKRGLTGKDHTAKRAAAYSLVHYMGSSSEGQAREALMSAARKDPEIRPLVVKLLAYHGARGVASVVPQLLSAQAGPAEVEAGAYAIEKLKLKQHLKLLERHRVGGQPFLQQQIDAAYKAAGG